MVTPGSWEMFKFFFWDFSDFPKLFPLNNTEFQIQSQNLSGSRSGTGGNTGSTTMNSGNFVGFLKLNFFQSKLF